MKLRSQLVILALCASEGTNAFVAPSQSSSSSSSSNRHTCLAFQKGHPDMGSQFLGGSGSRRRASSSGSPSRSIGADQNGPQKFHNGQPEAQSGAGIPTNSMRQRFQQPSGFPSQGFPIQEGDYMSGFLPQQQQGGFGRPGTLHERMMMGGPRPRQGQQLQGGSRESFSPQQDFYPEQMGVHLQSEGRPLHADVNIFQGPNNSPGRLRAYSEDGNARPWKAWFQTPRNGRGGNALDVRNSGPMEFPIEVEPNMMMMGGNPEEEEQMMMMMEEQEHERMMMGMGESGMESLMMSDQDRPMMIMGGGNNHGPFSQQDGPHMMADQDRMGIRGGMQGMNRPGVKEIQGDDLEYFRFDPDVKTVLVELFTDGLPIMATIELWQGPNNVKQLGEVFVDNGREKPFSTIIETPGDGCTITISNTGPIEYPIKASLKPIRSTTTR